MITLLLALTINIGTVDSLPESTRILLFQSIITDEATGYTGIKWNDWVDYLQKDYKQLLISTTPEYQLYLPCALDSIKDFYSIKLYKFKIIGRLDSSRMMLHYKDADSDVWLRLKGYTENDFKCLVDYLKSKKLQKKEIKCMLDEWGLLHNLYKELDLECQLKAVSSRDPHFSCFLSIYYKTINDLSIGFKPIEEEYASFSRIPFVGYFLSLK